MILCSITKTYSSRTQNVENCHHEGARFPDICTCLLITSPGASSRAPSFRYIIAMAHRNFVGVRSKYLLMVITRVSVCLISLTWISSFDPPSPAVSATIHLPKPPSIVLYLHVMARYAQTRLAKISQIMLILFRLSATWLSLFFEEQALPLI